MADPNTKINIKCISTYSVVADLPVWQTGYGKKRLRKQNTKIQIQIKIQIKIRNASAHIQ